MKRFSAFLGILGLVAAVALPAGAQQIKLFDKTYNVVKESRAGAYKNGKTVVLPDSGNQKAGLFFEEGAAGQPDRLWVACGMGGVTATHFYSLEGADANGVFSKAAANLNEYFGGNVDADTGGRPLFVTVLNRDNTGVKVDRNIVTTTQQGPDSYRFFDVDTLNGPFMDVTVLALAVRGTTPGENDTQADANSPFAFPSYAVGPGGSMLAFGRTESGTGVEIGVMNPKVNTFFPVLTNLSTATSNAVPDDVRPHGGFRYAEGEYWMIASTGDPAGDTDAAEAQNIYRLRTTFPADLSKGTPGSIKVEVLGKQEVLSQVTSTLGMSPGGIFGMAVGREVAPGLRRLYFADWTGNLYTATPVP